jgi:hypothetical protein
MPPESKRRPGGGGAAEFTSNQITADTSGNAGAAQAFADWCEPGELLLVRPEPCRRCPARILVGYILDRDGDCHGWSAQALGACGRPDGCGEKVHGITPEEAFGWRARG